MTVTPPEPSGGLGGGWDSLNECFHDLAICDGHPECLTCGERWYPLSWVAARLDAEATVEVVAQWLAASDGDSIASQYETDAEHILAALAAHLGATGRAPVVCDHPGIEHGQWSYTWECPRCHVCKFIGHGPLCGDCYSEAP